MKKLIIPLLVGCLLASQSFAYTVKFAWDRSASCTTEKPCGIRFYYGEDQGDNTIKESPYMQDIGLEPENTQYDLADNFVPLQSYCFAITAYKMDELYFESSYSNVVCAEIEMPPAPTNITIPPRGPMSPIMNLIFRIMQNN